MTGPDYLAELLAELLQGNELSSMTREWLIKNLLVYLRAGGDLSLDAALGLSGNGCRSTHTILATAIRNQHLRTALDGISLDTRLSQWARCCRLADQVSRLVPVFASTYRKAAKPPTDWPSWKAALFLAWRVGPEIPATAMGIQKAANRADGFSVCGEGLRVVATYAPQDARHEHTR